MQKKTVAVVVTYNRKEMLQENIECLLAQEPEIPSIIIIDNHSTDGTKEAVQRYIDDGFIEYYDTGSNLGGAGGFSYGMKIAAKTENDFIWVMDDDCMPKKGALQAFYEADRELNGEYGFLSSRVLWKDGSICKMNLQRKTVTSPLKNPETGTKQVVMASFVSLFLPRKVVLEIGLPIKEFFIWTDDWEYTRRISRRYPCYMVADSVVTHKSESNQGANIATAEKDRLDRFYYLYRNDVYLYRREGLKGFLYECARLVWHTAKIFGSDCSCKKERIQLILKGTREGLHFNPSIEYINQKEPF